MNHTCLSCSHHHSSSNEYDILCDVDKNIYHFAAGFSCPNNSVRYLKGELSVRYVE